MTEVFRYNQIRLFGKHLKDADTSGSSEPVFARNAH